MWAYESVFYQIYPLGFCGAPFDNPSAPLCAEDRNAGIKPEHSGENHSILKVIDWIDHLKRLNINAIYFSPLFESDTHGYNTRDYTIIDSRIGTNDDFKEVVNKLHEAGIKVIIDGVFNHVG
ncbi:MAG: maltodextrin glucosidase, partial [Lachnospiraceae bacterium]|nr:maltodextrin glucosidase [Lachnospiraceae bacterium]